MEKEMNKGEKEFLEKLKELNKLAEFYKVKHYELGDSEQTSEDESRIDPPNTEEESQATERTDGTGFEEHKEK
jgi:hypothetical protein